MPVIAKTEKLYLSSPEDLISRHHIPSFVHQNASVPSVLLNSNTLDHSLFIFRAHHRACSERRKHGLSYELQVEALRTGKYLEKLDCSTNTKHQHSSGNKGAEKHSQPENRDATGGGHAKVEPMDTNSFKQSPHSPLSTLKTGDRRYIQSQEISSKTVDSKLHLKTSRNTKASTMIYTVDGSQISAQSKSQTTACESEHGVLIKMEPGSGENTPQQCKGSPTSVAALPSSESKGKNNVVGPPKTKRRRYSIPTSMAPRSSSYSDDAGDDLSLSAEDCISGVISTPPIKPLEEGYGVVTSTPSPTTNPPLISSKSSNSNSNSRNGTGSKGSNSITTTASSTAKDKQRPETVSKNNDGAFTVKGDSLSQDLNDFTKVMEMVTKEQIAIERQASLTTPQQQTIGPQANDTAQRHSPPQRIDSPPPYFPPGAQPAVGTQIPRHLPISQPSYHSSQMQPFKYPVTPVPRRASVQEGLPDNLEFRQLTRSHSLVDGCHMQKHPRTLHLPGISPQVDQSRLMSPTVLSTPQTPITAPGFQDPPPLCPVSAPNPSSMNSQPPPTPTTPLEHFSSFQMPPTQQLVQSPTQSRQFFPHPVSTIASYQYSQTRATDSLVSPAGLPASMGTNWPQVQTHPNLVSLAPQGSLKENLLAQVNSRLEMITGQKRLPGQDAGFNNSPHLSAGPGTGHPCSIPNSLNISQLGSNYSAVGTNMSPEVNPTGLTCTPLSHTLAYQSHSHATATYPYTHHPM